MKEGPLTITMLMVPFMSGCLTAPDVSESGKYACVASTDCDSTMACRELEPGDFRCVDAVHREDAVEGADFPDCWVATVCDYQGAHTLTLSAEGKVSALGRIDDAWDNHNYTRYPNGNSPDRDVFFIAPPAGHLVNVVVRPAQPDSLTSLNPLLTIKSYNGESLRSSGYGPVEAHLRHAAPGGDGGSASLIIVVDEGDNDAQFQPGVGWQQVAGGALHDYELVVTTEPLPLVPLGTLDAGSPRLTGSGELSLPGDVRYYSFCAPQGRDFSVTVAVEQPGIEFFVEPLDSADGRLRHRTTNVLTGPASAVLSSADFVSNGSCDDDPTQESMVFAVFESAYQARPWSFSMDVTLK